MPLRSRSYQEVKTSHLCTWPGSLCCDNRVGIVRVWLTSFSFPKNFVTFRIFFTVHKWRPGSSCRELCYIKVACPSNEGHERNTLVWFFSLLKVHKFLLILVGKNKASLHQNQWWIISKELSLIASKVCMRLSAILHHFMEAKITLLH